MIEAPFSLYRVENVITEESASRGEPSSSEATPIEPATFREALDALDSDCWDNIDERGDGTIIAYPADYVQDIRTGDYSASELIIRARRPEWAARLVDCYRKGEAMKRASWSS
jgi:hypothetical protein